MDNSMTPDDNLALSSVDDACDQDEFSRRSVLKILSGLLGLVAWPWRAVRSAEAAPLRVKFRKGQTLRYVMTVAVNMQGSADGQNLSQDMTNDTILTWKVLSVRPDGVAIIEQTNDRSRLDMKNPGIEIQFDTAQPAEDKEREQPEELKAMTDGLRNIVGKPIELTVNPRGEIDEIKYSQEFLDALGMTQEFMDFGFKRDKPLKRRGELGLIELPVKALAIGQSSEEPRSLPNPVTDKVIKYNFKYTRKPAEKVGALEVARVDFVVEFAPESVKELGAQKYGAEGKILLDAQAGVIASIEYKQVMAISLGQDRNEQTVTRTTRLLAEGEDPFAKKKTE
jgi:hypothetical protein